MKSLDVKWGILSSSPPTACGIATFTTALGKALYRHYGPDPEDYETNILIEDGRAFFKSESAIRMLERLGAPWSAARVLRLAPAPLRDWLYDIVASNRLRWFGRRDQCLISAPRYEDRFLS